MSDETGQNDAYVRKFTFRPFTGLRRGRVYRIWSISWQWWTHEWDRSRAIKILIGFQLFTLLITNIILLSFRGLIPGIATEQLLEDTLISLVRGIVSFRTEIHADTNGSGDEFGNGGFTIGGSSFFILILCVLVGSGLIADDITNKTNEIYYAKLEKYEYIAGKFGAYFIFGNVIITLPYVLEFFLLFIGLGNMDFVTVFPVLIHVILFTEIVNLTFSAIILALSSLTGRRLYAGLTAFMLLFLANMIVPTLAFNTGQEIGLPLLTDVLTLLLICSYIIDGDTIISLTDFEGIEHTLNLTNGVGIEGWMILGSLGLVIMFGVLIVVFQVNRRHSS
ncbi:MAG: ABC transporter permease [Candidatus Heimdallarchaeaceae archaeon]